LISVSIFNGEVRKDDKGKVKKNKIKNKKKKKWRKKKTAKFLDEWTLSTHNCDINAICLNTNGSFTCACKTGYFGNGLNLNCTGKILFCFFVFFPNK